MARKVKISYPTLNSGIFPMVFWLCKIVWYVYYCFCTSGCGGVWWQGRQPFPTCDDPQALHLEPRQTRSSSLCALHLRRPHPLHGRQTEADQGPPHGPTAQDADDRAPAGAAHQHRGDHVPAPPCTAVQQQQRQRNGVQDIQPIHSYTRYSTHWCWADHRL